MKRLRWSRLSVLIILSLGAVAAAEEPSSPALNEPEAAPNVPKAADHASPPLDELDLLVDRAIETTSKRYLVVESHSPWQIAHGVLALRQDYLVKKDGKKVKALDWIATGPSYRGRPWFLITPHGAKGHPFTEPMAFEGHPNQFLALFTLSRLPLEAEFQTNGQKFTMGDLINNAKMEVNAYEEITWTLWALAYYLEPDAQWQNKNGEHWSMERLVQMQIASPVTQAACGGCHGLFALASARNSYIRTGKPLRGVWLEAHMHLERYIAAAQSMQNSDGSLSANYFRGSQYTTDVSKRISTTGHTLEFLMVALPQKRLGEPWVRDAVRSVARDLAESGQQELEPGGMYHALDAIVLYRERTRPTAAQEQLASLPDKKPTTSNDQKAPEPSTDSALETVAQEDEAEENLSAETPSEAATY